MNDIYAIRLANLNKLLKEPELAALRQREQAIQLNMGSSMLSQLTAGKKMGDDVARKIEVARKLPENWMDNVHGEMSQPARLDPAMLGLSIKALTIVEERRGVKFDPVAQPERVVQAYAMCAEIKGEPTEADLIDLGAKIAQALEANQGVAEDGREETEHIGGIAGAGTKGPSRDPT
jgi:hypothetical protein